MCTVRNKCKRKLHFREKGLELQHLSLHCTHALSGFGPELSLFDCILVGRFSALALPLRASLRPLSDFIHSV